MDAHDSLQKAEEFQDTKANRYSWHAMAVRIWIRAHQYMLKRCAIINSPSTNNINMHLARMLLQLATVVLSIHGWVQQQQHQAPDR
jgi:hypothetical protein